MIREWVRKKYVDYRRWRLLSAYAREFRIRTGKRGGLTPHLYALIEAEKDGVLVVEDDGTVDWRWPD